ncbi:hypothetical protein GCM10011332_19890 [Terasakiella brassicae]|uniref:Core-binding (CB) domain-containing protein n=1 Tax=Terasakiella brassicae TaxID=1634917 RepID=A0A917C1U1_9PROT|nr:hypothetical protein [Terasakiella brassicae]GGF65816.1 hypothetical protein GCM10011332_19890 [Terasakiella brassicae]
MPRFGGEPWVNESGEITIYQEKNKKEVAAFYYRLTIRGQKNRPSRSLASEFRYSPAHYAVLKRQYPITDPCDPPEGVIELARRVLSRAKDEVGKGSGTLETRKRPTLQQAADQYLDKVENDIELGLVPPSKYRRHLSFIRNYVKHYEPFRYMPIDEIDSYLMVDWQLWHDRFWIDGPGSEWDAQEVEVKGKVQLRTISDEQRKPPSKSTKTQAKSIMNSIFKWAAKSPRKWVSGPPRWDAYANEELTSARKPTGMFSDTEWADFVAKSQVYIEGEPREKPKQREDYHRRTLCYFFAQFMRCYGLRVAECYKLDASDLHINTDEHGDYYEVALDSVKHKIANVHQRVIGPAYGCRELSNTLIQSLPRFYEECYGIKFDRNCPLWMQEDGSKVQSFFNVFSTILKNTEYGYDANGNTRNLGSIRHATFTSEIMHSPYSAKIIAAWGGTSEAMLHKVYSKAFRYREFKESRRPAF